MQEQQILEILGGFLQTDEPYPQLCDLFSGISPQTAKNIFNSYILDFIKCEDDHKSTELIICFFYYWISDEYMIELIESPHYQILIDALQIKHYQSPLFIDQLAKKIKSANDQIVEFQLQSILLLMKADKTTADQIYNRNMKIIQEQFVINNQNIFYHYIQTQLLSFNHLSVQQKAKLDKIVNLIEEKSKPIQPELQARIQQYNQLLDIQKKSQQQQQTLTKFLKTIKKVNQQTIKINFGAYYYKMIYIQNLEQVKQSLAMIEEEYQDNYKQYGQQFFEII